MSEWQPIETAPKDGTDILCTWVYRLRDGTTHFCGDYAVLSWWPEWERENGSLGAWVLDGDFEAHFMPDEIHETPPIRYGNPTHWMPLPKPPTEAAK